MFHDAKVFPTLLNYLVNTKLTLIHTQFPFFAIFALLDSAIFIYHLWRKDKR